MSTPMGIMASARRSSSNDRMTRLKESTGAATGGASSETISFDEAGALGSSFLLVAICTARATTGTPVITPDSGWTAGAANGSSGSTSGRHNIYSRQGNGSVNGITLSYDLALSFSAVTLMAFEGFVSATPAFSLFVGTSGGSGSATFELDGLSLPSIPFGVILPSVSLQAGNNTTNTVTNDYTMQAFLNNPQKSARKPYFGGVGSYDTVITWGNSRANRRMVNVFELAA